MPASSIMTSNWKSGGGRGRPGGTVDDTYMSLAHTSPDTKTQEIYAHFMKQLSEQREQEKKDYKLKREMQPEKY